MGLGCSDKSRQKYGKWCALLDGIIGAAGAATPDPGGVVAVGTAALDPVVPTAAISEAVRQFNLKMYRRKRMFSLIRLGQYSIRWKLCAS
jgi:hypothetical protein